MSRAVRTSCAALLPLVAAATLACESARPPDDPSADSAAALSGRQGARADSAARLSPQRAPPDSGAVPATCDDLHDTMLKVPPTRQAFAREFGAPDSVVSSVEPNRHVPDAIDSLFAVHYPRLVLDIRTPARARDMATHVHAADNRYLAFPGIGIGASAQRVEDVLGQPHERSPQSLVYQCAAEVEQPVTFWIADGRVRAVEIAYYVD